MPYVTAAGAVFHTNPDVAQKLLISAAHEAQPLAIARLRYAVAIMECNRIKRAIRARRKHWI